jgi:hypothetical protein
MPGQAGYEPLRDEFHELYEQRMLRESTLFAAVMPVLLAAGWSLGTGQGLRPLQLLRALAIRWSLKLSRPLCRINPILAA